ncbi:tetratricopeptide repeat protein [Chloroflexota bacterium]
MKQMLRCPLSSEECSKNIVVQNKTFYLAEPEGSEEDRKRRRDVLDAALGNEYRIRSALEEKRHYIFTCNLCEMIQSCAYGIVEIKTGSSDVLLELGMMIALGKPIIILCRKGGSGLKLPPDIRAIGVIPFEEYADVIRPLREMSAKLPLSIPLNDAVDKIKGMSGAEKPLSAEELKQITAEYGSRQIIEFDEVAKEADADTNLFVKEQAEVSPELAEKKGKIENIQAHPDEPDSIEDADTALSRGNRYYEREEYKLAIENYDLALILKPELSDAWKSKGLALDKLERYEESIKCFDRVIEINPDDSDAWLDKGVALGNIERYEEALECCDEAIELRPNDSNAWFNKGVALVNLNRYEDAVKCCDKAIEIKPDYHEAWTNKSAIFNSLERYEEAVECCNKSIEIKPDDSNIWFNKWIALSNLGQYDEAMECYEKAVELQPDDEVNHTDLLQD